MSRLISVKVTATQLLRYAFVGVASNITGYLIYLLFTHLGATPKLTMTLLYGVGATVGYIGNRSVTFSYNGAIVGSGFRYSLAHIAGYFINLSVLIVFVDHLGYPHQVVQAVAILVVALFLFTAFKVFVFRSSNAERYKGNI